MKRILKYLKPYWLNALLSPVMMIGEVFADLCLPYLMSFIVNYGISGISWTDPVNGSAIAARLISIFLGDEPTRMGIIILFGAMMLVITLFGGFFGTMTAYTSSKASQGMGHDLRRDAYRHVMNLSIEQTDKFTTGSLVTRMTNDVSMVVDFVESLLRMFVRSPMFLIGGTIMLITLNLKFGVVLLCAFPILIGLIVFLLMKAVPFFSIVQKKLDKVNSVVQEDVGGARVVKAYVREDYECSRFSRANGELRDTNLSVFRLLAIISPVLNIVMNLAIVAVIYIGGYNISIEAEGMTTGSVMAAISYITQVIMSVMMLAGMFAQISRASASIKRVNELLDTDPVILDGSTRDASSEVAVSFRNVDFHYPGTVGRPVLKDVNIDIRKGETFAVIGATGSGKTSLVSLIPRFYDVTGGEVLVDGVNVKEYELASLRKKIGYVMQKSELFSDTVKGNIRWGRPEADDAQIKEAALTAQADEFVSSFTEGYDTFIAEKGASLSGGQKQRISIARALVRRPEILILDDSTSALDLATEARLRKALKENFGGTTVIMIAQRIASVMEADRIAVIESDGTIRHCASHEELMRTSDTYRDIYDSQMKSGAYQIKGGENV